MEWASHAWLNERSSHWRLIKRSGFNPLGCEMTVPSLSVGVILQASTMKGTVTHTSLTHSIENCTRWPTSWISHVNGLSFLPTLSALFVDFWSFLCDLQKEKKKQEKKKERELSTGPTALQAKLKSL